MSRPNINSQLSIINSFLLVLALVTVLSSGCQVPSPKPTPTPSPPPSPATDLSGVIRSTLTAERSARAKLAQTISQTTATPAEQGAMWAEGDRQIADAVNTKLRTSIEAAFKANPDNKPVWQQISAGYAP